MGVRRFLGLLLGAVLPYKRAMMLDRNAPIGIFDSGIGGLTVLSAVRKALPSENLVYLGDTARVPYGTKSAETVARYASECADFLLKRNVKAIVVACNTASAYALSELTRKFDVPVLGVIGPGAKAAVVASKRRSIGVIGTWGTISSNAYGKALKALDKDICVISSACPLFVPLVEEGWTDNDVTRAAAARYLEGLKNESIDALILGCTHYPLLKEAIAEFMGGGVSLVDSADTTAGALKDLLEGMDLMAEAGRGSYNLYVTDLPTKFEMIAEKFLGEMPPRVTRVDL